MLIDDKKVASAIKKSKSSVKVRYLDKQLQIICGEWFALIDVDAAPEKPKLTLAALVEMLGYIPEGLCLSLQKEKDDYAAQDMMNDAFLAEASGFIAGRDAVPIEIIPLAYGAVQLYQAEDLRVVGVRPEALRICSERNAPRFSEELSTFICTDDNSAFACRAVRSDSAPWRALENFRWTKKAREEQSEPEDNGQMEMEDGADV